MARCRIVCAALAAAGLLGACDQRASRIEEASRRPAVAARPPVILIPGVSREVGRVLRGGALVPFSALALRTDAEALAKLGDPRFPVDGASPTALPAKLDRALRGTDVRGLQALIDRLVREEGYVRGDPDQPRDKDYPENAAADRRDRTRVASLFVLYYDWRRDLAESACFVAQQIERIRAAAGAPRVLVVGHSLGGVVARYYVRYGGRDAVNERECPLADGARPAAINAPGAERTARLVMLGGPHRGTALAFRGFLQDFNLFGLLGLGLREAVFTMPLSWQQLPYAEADGQVPLLVSASGEERVPLFALRTWVERRWLPGNGEDAERRRFAEAMLARAAALQQRMTGPHPAEEAIPRLAAGGTCRPTLTRAFGTANGVEFLARGQTDHPLFARATAPGDGVVTAESALGLPASPTLTLLTTCTGHNTYLEDQDVVARIVRFLFEE